MTDWRHLVDLTWWNADGSSWMGLTYTQAKWLGGSLIALGTLLAVPDPFTAPLNQWAADQFSGHAGLTPASALIFTYTLLPATLILLGAWIYPYDTHSFLNGTLSRLKRLITHPVVAGLALLTLYIQFKQQTGGAP